MDKKLNENIKSVKGNVCIEYIDPLTDKVKERIKGENHIFEDSFKCNFWHQILTQSRLDQFFVTDDNTYPSDSFPYLRGNIIGWGRPDAALPGGGRRGRFLPNESIRFGEDIGGGMGRKFRYTYLFGSDALNEGIGSFGFTSQYNPNMWNTAITSNGIFTDAILPHLPFYLKPVRERMFQEFGILPNSDSVFKENVTYWFDAIRREVHILDLMRCSHKTVSVATYCEEPDLLVSRMGVGIAFDSPNVFLLTQTEDVGKRYLYVFENDGFDKMLHSYHVPNVTLPTPVRAFAVYGSKIFAYAPTAQCVEDYKDIEATWENMEMVACPFGAIPTGVGRITIFDGIFYTFGQGRRRLYSVETKLQIATAASVAALGVHNVPITHGTCLDISLDNPMFLHSTFGYGTVVSNIMTSLVYTFVTTQALCCYANPDGEYRKLTQTEKKFHILSMFFTRLYRFSGFGGVGWLQTTKNLTKTSNQSREKYVSNTSTL